LPGLSPNTSPSGWGHKASFDQQRDSHLACAHALVIKHTIIFDVLSAHRG
jgi:hypothetical protein